MRAGSPPRQCITIRRETPQYFIIFSARLDPFSVVCVGWINTPACNQQTLTGLRQRYLWSILNVETFTGSFALAKLEGYWFFQKYFRKRPIHYTNMRSLIFCSIQETKWTIKITQHRPSNSSIFLWPIKVCKYIVWNSHLHPSFTSAVKGNILSHNCGMDGMGGMSG